MDVKATYTGMEAEKKRKGSTLYKAGNDQLEKS
jgi:hypothetical protein